MSYASLAPMGKTVLICSVTSSWPDTMSPDDAPSSRTRGTFEMFLDASDIAQMPALSDDAWSQIRQSALRRLAWHFCTLRNLWVYRGRYLHDVIGFGWAGIYRSLQVASIVSTSYRNEGHFRASDRIFGTSDFFSGAFRFSTSSPALTELIRVVNLRHHVAGVVTGRGDAVSVVPGYEADYAYVATGFIESLRRGYAACGISPTSARGRELGEQLCTILYKVAGLTGLERMPRGLGGHERFRDAYEAQIAASPPSPRVQRMAQEIAHRIVPLTAAMSRVTVAEHVQRHFDQPTASLLFPGGEIPHDLETQQIEWRHRFANMPSMLAVEPRAASRTPLWERPDVAALLKAYHTADAVLTADRLIGAVLLYLLDADTSAVSPLERRTIQLSPGEALIQQGQTVSEMYVLLSTTAELIVEQTGDASPEPRQLATLHPPTVIGEIGMWRNQPAVATVLSRESNTVEALVIDAAHFALLKTESGFRAATAAEVQRRLALNARHAASMLDGTAEATGDALLTSLAQLFRYLTGDSHVPLDAVIDLPDDATPAECVDALRDQVDEAVRSRNLPPDLTSLLQTIVATIG
jgi:CRP-like cAMP-binding protein